MFIKLIKQRKVIRLNELYQSELLILMRLMAKMRIVVYAFQKINKNKCKLKLKDKDNRIQKLRECDLNKDFH